MPETDISQTDYSDLTNTIVDYSVDSASLDGATGLDETTWQMTEWETYLGYYKEIPELQVAIDAKANWVVGAGFTADEPTELLISIIKGNGKDSFNDILLNMQRVKDIGGDAFAEIIRDKNGDLINLKPLDPSSIVIVQNKKGRVKRYEQVSKTAAGEKHIVKFKPNEIFHLSRKRLGDEIHGVSVVKACEWIIKARNEAMTDMKTLMHRHVIPRFKYELDTDDPTKIAAFKNKADAATVYGENIYIPKGAVEQELIAVPQNATLNPITWIDKLNDYFFQAVNVPQIIIGNAKEFTDASGKIVYLAFEQSVKGEQLYIEEQVLSQLNLEIELTFPASLQNEALSDQARMSDMVAAQPNDMTAEMEGRK